MKKLFTLASGAIVAGSVGVTALLAGSTPSFANPTNYPMGRGPNSVAIRDLNGDGARGGVDAAVRDRQIRFAVPIQVADRDRCGAAPGCVALRRRERRRRAGVRRSAHRAADDEQAGH